MLIVMRHGAAAEEIQRVVETIEEMGYQARPMPGKQRTTVGLVGNDGRVDGSRLAALPGVQEILHVTKPYKQVSREWQPESTIIRLPGGLAIGGEEVVVMAGPCSVESERQILAAARASARQGRRSFARVRSSLALTVRLPRSGTRRTRPARPGSRGNRPPHCHRSVDAEDVDHVAKYADILQIGARNMQNYSLLKAAAATASPCSSSAASRHHRGAAPRGRIYAGGGNQAGDALRARDSHFDPATRTPARPGDRGRACTADHISRRRRPQPRHGPHAHGDPDGPGRHGGRRRRDPRRGAPQPGSRPVRWGAEPLSRAVRADDEGMVRLIAETIGRRVAEPAGARA